MIKGIYLAARSLNNGFQRISNIANNLANINTTGYKRELPFFEVLDKAGKPTIKQMVDYTQGDFSKTSNQLDLAISGSGFFAVKKNDKIELTRNGRFNISEDGFIVNQNGSKLMGKGGAINVSDLELAKNNELKIMKNGKIYLGKELLGEIVIMNPKDTSTLQRDSNLNFYSDTENYQPIQSENYKIFQGYLENSNVNTISEMQAMISTNSDYQSSYKIITYLDKSLEKANEIGKV